MKLISAINDQHPINNVLLALSMDFDEVFFLYRNDERQRVLKRIEIVIKKHKDMPLHFVELVDDKADVEQLLENNTDLCIDCGESKYISLFLFEEGLKRHIPMIFYDSQENNIKGYRLHRMICDKMAPLTIEDIMILGGGKLKKNMHQFPDLNNKAFCDSVCAIVEKTVNHYSEFTGYVQKINKLIGEPSFDGLTYRIPENQRESILRDGMTNLCVQCGLFYIKDDYLIFNDAFTSPLFDVSGAFLEAYLYIQLCRSNQFDEVMMSTIVDFSSGSNKNQQVICELDGLAMRDNHLVFISCKSNKVDTYAINEIKLHSLMFGNELSHAALVTLDDLDSKSPSVYAKAKELRVAVIDNTAIGNGELAQQMLAVVDGTYRYEKIEN